MYPLKKGKTAKQAHVGLPKGTYEEEHGRKGFYGKSAHLYHAHPPTGWIRFEGKLRPHCIDCNKLKPTDLTDPKGSPVAFLGNDDIVVSVSRRSKPMPFYFRNADGDELYFVHRGEGTIETDFGPLDVREGRLHRDPARRDLPGRPEDDGQFLPDHGIGDGVRAAGEGADRAARALRSGGDHDTRTDTEPERPQGVGGPDQGRERILVDFLSLQPDRRGRLEGRPDRLEDQHARHPPDHEPPGPPPAERPHARS